MNWVEKEWGWMVGEIHKCGWLQMFVVDGHLKKKIIVVF